MGDEAVEQSGWRSWLRLAWPRRGDWRLLAVYAVLFWVTHSIAALWGGPGFYSLFFPPAGLRFALLWLFGARLTVAVALVELLVQLVTGVLDLTDPGWPTMAISIVRPALAYGIAIGGVKMLTQGRRDQLSTPPLPFAIASVAAPVAAMLATLPWSILRPDATHIVTSRDLLASMTVFTVGDLLGVLLLAPPLIYIADVRAGRERLDLRPPDIAHLIEGIAVLAAASVIIWQLNKANLGAPPAPYVLATAWIGLRFGRPAAWGAIAASALVVFPFTARFVAVNEKLDFHMGLASVAAAGYLAASFRAAETRAREDIARRDRMLFQAERLKTLRSMSVAVIHEISQPLSTLAIEARHLKSASAESSADIAESAAIIERKTSALSEMIRRLRRFGGRAVEETGPIGLGDLLHNVEELVRFDCRDLGVALHVAPVDPELYLVAQDVELGQALVNLVRNALQAEAQGATVTVVATKQPPDEIRIDIANTLGKRPGDNGGMGVGLLVARAIVESHGGQVAQSTVDGGGVLTRVSLRAWSGQA